MSKRNPPLPLKREVRREGYFGCVICGNPIIEYHHIEPFHKVKEHSKDNLVILCPEHHHRADQREIPKEIITKSKMNPYNKDKQYISKDFFLHSGEDIKIKVGSNTYINTPEIIVVDNFPLITLHRGQDGYPLLNAKFFDEKDEISAEIIDNEWSVYKHSEIWDVQYKPGHLKVNNEKGKINLELEIEEELIKLRGDLYYKGYKVELFPNKTILGDNNAIISNSTFVNSRVGIFISLGSLS